MLDRSSPRNIKSLAKDLPGQVVLVLQGGGALGSYQAGVYQALHEAGIEPDWIIGTSIGAINASLIAGNEPADRLGGRAPRRACVPATSPPTGWRPCANSESAWSRSRSGVSAQRFPGSTSGCPPSRPS